VFDIAQPAADGRDDISRPDSSVGYFGVNVITTNKNRVLWNRVCAAWQTGCRRRMHYHLRGDHMRPRILFRGSTNVRGGETAENEPKESAVDYAIRVAHELGAAIVREGFDLILTGSQTLEVAVGEAAVEACKTLSVEPRERIRTYLRTRTLPTTGFGMILRPIGDSRRHLRTQCVAEASAVVGLMGGEGTSDCIMRAELARKLVFPIAIAGGGAREEWIRLKTKGYKNRDSGDIDFLDDTGADPKTLVAMILDHCKRALHGEEPPRPRRIFIVHGHGELRNELARLLTKLKFEPIILTEQPDSGLTVKEKLLAQVTDVGFAFILYTPDDVGGVQGGRTRLSRARQNVVFEHGLLIGILGKTRVCAIIQEGRPGVQGIELFSDLHGELQKRISFNQSMQDTLGIPLARELMAAGYDVDMDLLTSK
jgi:predicted nucleotide-binding protein